MLDFSRVVAGPFATRMLSDLGADVVKVEPPDGDFTRAWGTEIGGLTGFYTQQNVGKRNICVDLKAEGATDLLLEMGAQADLIVENYRPGVLDRLGLGYEAFKAVNPKVIMLSISGFGQNNEWSNRAAFAPILHAESGLLARQAEFDDAVPSDPMVSIADYDSAMHGTIGLLSALWLRERTGVGQHIDMAMINAMTASDDYAHHALDHSDVERLGGQVRATGYGHILISGNEKAQWYQLSKVGKVADDPTVTKGDVPAKIAARARILDEFFASYTDRDALVASLDEANVAWADIRDSVDVFTTPVAEARRLSVEVDDRAGGTRRVVDTPYRFSDASAGIRRPAPYRGEHNSEVLNEWLGRADVEALASAGILHQEPAAINPAANHPAANNPASST